MHNNEHLAIVIIEDVTELSSLKQRLKAEQSFAGIVGADSAMFDLFETIRDLTDVKIPVLIEGESGTGKSLSHPPSITKAFGPINPLYR